DCPLHRLTPGRWSRRPSDLAARGPGHPGRFWDAAPPSSLSRRLAGDGGREICGGALDEGAGDVGQTLVGVPGVIAQHPEGAVHVDAEPLGELALGLLDHGPAV